MSAPDLRPFCETCGKPEREACRAGRCKNLYVAPKACATCPYRRDTPAGIWSPEEYEKLREYDEGGGELATWPDGSQHRVPCLRTFHCHQENITGVQTACRGWLSVHRYVVAIRVAVIYGFLRAEDIPEEDESGVYYASGNEAADAGLAGVKVVSDEARVAQDRLLRRGSFGLRE